MEFKNTPIKISSEKIDNGSGYWNYMKINIYYNNVLIGDYIRNYCSHELETFYPFKQDGWYALYSKDYQTISVMKLFEDHVEHWCDWKYGFCPVEFYIPAYYEQKCETTIRDKIIKYSIYSFDNEKYENDTDDDKDITYDNYCEFGLCSGCHWGDDSSWKIRYIDLTKIQNKELNVIEKFGYWEQPNGLKLKECIDMTNWDKEHPTIILYKQESFRL